MKNKNLVVLCIFSVFFNLGAIILHTLDILNTVKDVTAISHLYAVLLGSLGLIVTCGAYFDLQR